MIGYFNPTNYLARMMTDKQIDLLEENQGIPDLFIHRIPILILNWEGTSDTLKCIHKLADQWMKQFFIYLMDNGSSSNELFTLREGIAGLDFVHFVAFKNNYGFVGAHNFAFQQLIEQCQSPGFILLNNDAFAQPLFLSEMLQQISMRPERLVACKMIQYFDDSSMDNAGHFMLNTSEIMPLASGDAESQWNASCENIGPCAGACYYPKKMIEQLGGFDTFFHTGYEDAELGLRATVTGYECIYWPAAAVLHKISTSINRVKDFEYVKKTQINIFYTWWKLMPAGALWANLPFVILKYFLVLIMDVITFRWKMLSVTWSAIWACLWSERKIIAQARKDFHREHKTISSWKMLSKQRFFLFVDLKRFYNFYVKGERTFFESHDSNRSSEE